jgi:hypothetical protein
MFRIDVPLKAFERWHTHPSRRKIWRHQISFMSRLRQDSIEIPHHIWNRMENAFA